MLKVFTLGGIKLELDGEPITKLVSRKSAVLIAFLAFTGETYRREEMAELLWQERPQKQSLANLRVLLSNLRKHLRDYILITRETVSIHPDANLWLDITELERGLSSDSPQDYLHLYDGSYLEGIFLREAPEFEQLILTSREEINARLADKLHHCVQKSIKTADYPGGLACARLLLKIDPFHEQACRQMMALLYLDGQRQAAIRHFSEYQSRLKNEWSVEPEQSGFDLLECIKADEKQSVISMMVGEKLEKPPAFLDFTMKPSIPRGHVFVGRQVQLDILNKFLEKACSSKGGIAFVCGEPGRGKSALMRYFVDHALTQHENLLVTWSSSSAFKNIGDPLLVWRDAFRMLVGDVERLWLAGAITRKHAQALWQGLPVVADAIAEYSPELVQTLLKGIPLKRLFLSHPECDFQVFSRLFSEVPRDQNNIHSGMMAEQLSQVLCTVAEKHPIMMVLDDAHWADRSSISLLMQLVRRLENSRAFIVCTYRPDELMADAQYGRHPLRKVINECKRRYGNVQVDLDHISHQERRSFVDALLDIEPNNFSYQFRDNFFKRTQGDALFSVELMRDLRERGILIQEKKRGWEIVSDFTWEGLPDKVLGVVEERIGRLLPEHQKILRVASLIGDKFPAQLVSKVLNMDEAELLGVLSHTLQRQHRLVREQSIECIDNAKITYFEFSHNMYHQYLLDNRIGEGEDINIHKLIAHHMESLYAGQMDQVAAKLAHHWLAAREEQAASKYLDIAGDQARAQYALDDAEIFYCKAIAIRQAIGMGSSAGEIYLKLGLAKLADYDWETALEAYEKGFELLAGNTSRIRENNATQNRQTLRLAIARPLTLDPGLMKSEISAYYGGQLFEGLVTIDPHKNALPAAASHWEIRENGCCYIFHLRPNLLWSNGQPLVAGDFEYAWKRNLKPTAGGESFSPCAHLLFPVRNARAFSMGGEPAKNLGVRALDDKTLLVELERPIAYFLLLMAQCVAFPLPEEILNKQGDSWMDRDNFVCNGPYTLGEWGSEENIILVRNPFFCGAFPGNVDRVECISSSTEISIIEKFLFGELDAISLANASMKLRRYAHNAVEAHLHQVPDAKVWYALLRVDQKPFDDVRIRQAFRYSIDRKRLVEEGFRDGRIPAYGGFLPPNIPGHAENITGNDDDYSRGIAQNFLEEAGYPGGKGLPEIVCTHPEGGRRVVKLLIGMWESCLGVKVVPEEKDYQKLIDQVDSNPAPITLLGFSEHYPDPHCFLSQFYHGNNPNQFNRSRWHHEEFDRLIKQAEIIQDQAKRLEIYRQADRILVDEEVVVIPISYGMSGMLLKPNSKILDHATGYLRFKDIIVDAQ